MKHEPLKTVACVGSVAHVSLWEIEKPAAFPHYGLGKWGGSILGNDAIIVARELKSHGFKPKCILLNATNSDVKCVVEVLGRDSIIAVDTEKGSVTRSLCLEDASEQRIWIFSRSPKPKTKLSSLAANILYVDYYKEFIGFLNANLKMAENGKRLIFVNLSSISAASEIPKLAVKPEVIQVSVPKNVGLHDAGVLALELVRKTFAKKVFVTMGSRGAILACGNKTWYAKPTTKLNNCILGAGALFSSKVIIGLASGLERDVLIDWSVNQTASRLKSWSKNEINRF